jgi:hypothetical protein
MLRNSLRRDWGMSVSALECFSARNRRWLPTVLSGRPEVSLIDGDGVAVQVFERAYCH